MPNTKPGKAIACRNATTHGLFCRDVVLPALGEEDAVNAEMKVHERLRQVRESTEMTGIALIEAALDTQTKRNCENELRPAPVTPATDTKNPCPDKHISKFAKTNSMWILFPSEFPKLGAKAPPFFLARFCPVPVWYTRAHTFGVNCLEVTRSRAGEKSSWQIGSER